MRLLCMLLATAAVTTGCASPKYFLATRPHPGFLSPTDETTPTVAVDGVALIYDRARWVAIERESSDGSAWVYYALTIKNGSPKSVTPNLEKTAIKFHGGGDASAVIAPEDLKVASKEISSGSVLRVTSRFHLAAQVVREAANSSDPLELSIPLRNGSVLQQKVWLWRD